MYPATRISKGCRDIYIHIEARHGVLCSFLVFSLNPRPLALQTSWTREGELFVFYSHLPRPSNVVFFGNPNKSLTKGTTLQGPGMHVLVSRTWGSLFVCGRSRPALLLGRTCWNWSVVTISKGRYLRNFGWLQLRFGDLLNPEPSNPNPLPETPNPGH